MLLVLLLSVFLLEYGRGRNLRESGRAVLPAVLASLATPILQGLPTSVMLGVVLFVYLVRELWEHFPKPRRIPGVSRKISRHRRPRSAPR